MKTLVMATIYMCLTGGACEKHQVRIEQKACKTSAYEAQVPYNGEWKDAKIGVTCQ